MRNCTIRDLADCTEFRQTIEAQPPAVMHGTAIVLFVFLAGAVSWGALTKANLVVRAPGRVRPVAPAVQVFLPENGERPGYSIANRVDEVFYREGDVVRKGQPLIRLNTRLLDEEITRLELTAADAEAQLRNSQERAELLVARFQAARAKAEAELAEVEEDIRQRRKKRELEHQQAEQEYQHAKTQEIRTQELHEHQAASDAELEDAELKVRQAEAKLELARQPIDEQKLASRQKEAELLEKDYAVQRKDAEMEQAKTAAELKKTRRELKALGQQRELATLRSPLDGLVVTPEVKPGGVLQRGKEVVEIAERSGFYFEAAVPSTEIGHLSVGMPARIKLDAYDYQRYGTLPGTVVFISPDSRPVENAAGGKHLVYEVRIRLEEDEVGRDELRGPVQLGLTGPAEIVTDQQSVLSILLKKIQRTISLG